MEIEKNIEWKLKSISIDFKKGYSFKDKEEDKQDRYEGKICFMNNEFESFNLNIPNELTQRYLDLMSEDIIQTASYLGVKIAESIINKIK